MPELRTTHRGSITARRTYGRCWMGVWGLAAFCFVSSMVQNTVTVHRGTSALVANIARQEAERAELQREGVELRAQREYLRSPAGVLAEARKLGYARPGEHHGLTEAPR